MVCMYVAGWYSTINRWQWQWPHATTNKQANIREEAKTAWVSKGIGIGYPNDRSALSALEILLSRSHSSLQGTDPSVVFRSVLGVLRGTNSGTRLKSMDFPQIQCSVVRFQFEITKEKGERKGDGGAKANLPCFSINTGPHSRETRNPKKPSLSTSLKFKS